MNDDKRKRPGVTILAVVLNTVLVICVILSVLYTFTNAQKTAFSQNIENVRTLTNSSANKVELEMTHQTRRLRSVAQYVNNYNGVGMTMEEIFAYFEAYYPSEAAPYVWQLADNHLNSNTGAFKGIDAVALCKSEEGAFYYSLQAYPELARIFRAASELTLDDVHYTSEFTDRSPALAKSFAITTTVRVRDAELADAYQYKTLMLLLDSDYINQLIASNNDIDTLSFFDYSNIVIDNDGNYVISNSYFQGTNFLDYIALYNDDFSVEDAAAVTEKLKLEDYFDVLYYKNNLGEDCAYTIVPVQNSGWHILSIVPLVSFHNDYDFSGSFLIFAVPFALLFLVDIIFVLLINRRLRQKTKEAEAANQSKSVFLSSMSHDIRTPMNAIIGMTVIAGKQLDEEPVDRAALKDCMKSIELSGNHLMTLINDVLDISKIESGKIALHPSDFSIADTVAKVIDICQSRIKEKDFVFESHIQNVTHEYVTGDSLRINQIFINILTNAIKYTEPGGKITVDLSEEAVPTQAHMARYVYKVSDTGIGMAPEFIDSIFDRFTRAVDTRINSVQGTGLGMSIVKQLLDLMGGSIHVDSELNVGSTFTVTIDLPVVQDRLEGAQYDRLPILLIDDDPVLLETVSMSLTEAGAEVDTAPNGPRGIEMALARHSAKKDYKIIFVDWKMSLMPGCEVIRELRSKLGSGVRIIVMTAYSVTEVESEARLSGANYYVTKPLFKSKLISTIELALSGEEAQKKPDSESFHDMRILVAEDNETNWKIMHKLLKFYGIHAERAENGRIAVDAVQNAHHLPDLVLMDIQMPVMNGYEATRAIRQLEDGDRAAVPIYAMTADAFEDDIRKCEAAGMNGHLSKPVEINRLLDIIKDVYAKHHPA